MDTSNAIKIENWAVQCLSDAYTAPECRVYILCGQVYGHPNPRHHDGKEVATSGIKNIEGRIVQTAHNTYILGEPKAEYVEWCKSNGYHVPSAECPIKFEKSS